jgi:hypothetical protein
MRSWMLYIKECALLSHILLLFSLEPFSKENRTTTFTLCSHSLSLAALALYFSIAFLAQPIETCTVLLSSSWLIFFEHVCNLSTRKTYTVHFVLFFHAQSIKEWKDAADGRRPIILTSGPFSLGNLCHSIYMQAVSIGVGWTRPGQNQRERERESRGDWRTQCCGRWTKPWPGSESPPPHSIQIRIRQTRTNLPAEIIGAHIFRLTPSPRQHGSTPSPGSSGKRFWFARARSLGTLRLVLLLATN